MDTNTQQVSLASEVRDLIASAGDMLTAQEAAAWGDRKNRVLAAVAALEGGEHPCIGGAYCARTTNGWFSTGSHGPGWYCGWCEAIPVR